MAEFRRLIATHRAAFALLLAAALFLRVLVPVGFMPDLSGGKIEISLCTGHGPAKAMVAMPGMVGKADKPAGRQHRGDMPCAFAGLAMPGLAGADPIQLALAIALLVATALFVVPSFVVRRASRLRPPLRGPPLSI